MDAFGYILFGISIILVIFSFWNIISPKSPYNKMKKEKENNEVEISDNNNITFNQDEFQNKIKEAQKRAIEDCKRHREYTEELQRKRDKEIAEIIARNPAPEYKGRKPSIDSIGRAMDGIGVEFKIVGMKYRAIDEQLQAKCLDPGDTVLLIPEINDISGDEAMALYTQTKSLIGYVVTEQTKRARDMMYMEYLQAFVKTPWEMDNSWFLIVVPKQD